MENQNKSQKKQRKPVKVPVIMQMEALECGAASLAMIMAYYGKWISLEEARRDCGVSQNGSTAKNILKAARSYGMEAKGYRYKMSYLVEHGKFPCIIFWDFNHFVVLDGFWKNRAYLNDPARGKVTVSMEEFDRSFTGVCLNFQPTGQFQPGGKQKSMKEYTIERLKGSRVAILFTLMTTLISTLIGIISPGFSRVFMDRILTGNSPDWSRSFFLLYALFLGVQIMVAFISTRMRYQLNGKMGAVGNSEYLWKVLHLPMHFFSQRTAGDLFQRQSLNAEIAEALVNKVSPLILQAAMLVFYLVVMLRYSVVLSIFGIGTVLVNIAVAGIITSKKINYARVQLRDAAKLESSTVTGLEMIENIKSCGAENGFFQKWSGYQASINRQEVEVQRYETLIGIIPEMLTTLNDTLILVLGIWLIIQGQLTIGMLTAFQGYLIAFLEPATNLIDTAQELQEMRVQMERIEDVMKYPTDQISQNTEQEAADYRKLSGELTIRGVTFGYSRLDEPLIKNFHLELQPGKSVALVGRSGCGKSTLTRLISGLYQPWEGEILFDGKPIWEINHRIFTGSVAVVDQDIVLFEDSIANNIKMWDESIEDFEMILAARDAQIHDDIMLREEGYQYVLMEDGRDFSGGQRQRLEIARVLAQDPTIIILDEATSALDAKTEAEVVKAITDRGITCIVVAHRLSTIRDCDEIIVLDHGETVERGTHQELLAKGGAYTELVTVD